MTLEVKGGFNRPLDQHCCFETYDLDQAREMVGHHFCSHVLDRASSDGHFLARKNRLPGKNVALNYLHYGADVLIEPGELTGFYLVQIPLAGQALVVNGKSEVLSGPRIATILNPDLETKMRWFSGCEQMLIQINRSYLIDIAQQVTGLGHIETLRFDPLIDFQKPELAEWLQKVQALFQVAGTENLFQTLGNAHQRVLEESLVTGLILAQPSSVSALLNRPTPDISPAVFYRATREISERFTGPITMLDIARWAQTTPRTLQLAFKRTAGMSPMQYVRELRLGYARHLLLTKQDNACVGDVAEKSGHAHFGRFSTAYKLRFGESPSETVRITRFS